MANSRRQIPLHQAPEAQLVMSLLLISRSLWINKHKCSTSLSVLKLQRPFLAALLKGRLWWRYPQLQARTYEDNHSRPSVLCVGGGGWNVLIMIVASGAAKTVMMARIGTDIAWYVVRRAGTWFAYTRDTTCVQSVMRKLRTLQFIRVVIVAVVLVQRS